VEALIGAAYLSGGKSIQAALDAMHALHVPIQLQSTAELQTGSVVARLLGGRTRPSEGPLTILGYEFKDSAKGRSALCLPPSAANHEQWLFLGNAVLELLVSEHAWTHLHLTPHEMTRIKHGSVRLDALAALAVATNVVEQLAVAPPAQDRLDAFVAEMRTAEGLAGLQDQREYWLQTSDFKVSRGDS
jgi:dsRNA-specific ribonuclease